MQTEGRLVSPLAVFILRMYAMVKSLTRLLAHLLLIGVQFPEIRFI